MSWRVGIVSVLIVASAAAARQASQSAATSTCALRIELVDGRNGEPLAGVIRVRGKDGANIEVPELVNRGQGIEKQGSIHAWWTLPKPATITVPASALVVEALAGLETELAVERVDLSGKQEASLRIPLARFAEERRQGHVAGNTHLHLMKLSKAQADRYLGEVPLVDGLDIVFISYLERADATPEYTSNNYTPGDLERLSRGHVHLGHGQEHRHNFESHGEGYGHILLLDIPHIIQPVSIGPGITKQGPDAPPLQTGIDQARRAGGKVVWAHNMYGFEDIPNWVTGRVHANNIFDGSERGSYKNTYYRYLNIGLHVPFSTGTDWFIYDFSRVYVLADRPITPTEWLDRLAAGKSWISNGPLLRLTVDDQALGSELKLEKPRAVRIRASAVGRLDFKRIELVRGGRVVRSAASRPEQGHFTATMEVDEMIDAPAWLALRTPPPPVANDAQLQEPVGNNEFDGRLFAHTSPIYITLAGQGVFDAATAAGLVEEMKASVQVIEAKAVFDTDAQRKSVLRVYEDAIEALEERLGR